MSMVRAMNERDELVVSVLSLGGPELSSQSEAFRFKSARLTGRLRRLGP
jgi:hypothetical protein